MPCVQQLYRPEWLKIRLTIAAYQWMNAVCFGISTFVDPILTGAFSSITRESRTRFPGYAHIQFRAPRMQKN